MKNVKRTDKAIEEYGINEEKRRSEEKTFEDLAADIKIHEFPEFLAAKIEEKREKIGNGRKHDLAKICLAVTREAAGKGPVDEIADFLIEKVPNLKEIGTSKRELQDLKRKGAKQEVKNFLKGIRSDANQTSVKSELETLMELLEERGLSLEEIGSSGGELKTILKKGYKNSAIKNLSDARKYKEKRDVYSEVGNVKSLARQRKITFKEIGTSKRELDRIIKQSRKCIAVRNLEEARTLKKQGNKEGARQASEKVRAMFGIFNTDGNSLESIGTTKEELDQLEKESFWDVLKNILK